MLEMNVSEARNRLGSLFDLVERGDEVVITRRGKAVVRLVPVAPAFDRAKAQRAVEGLREVRRGLTLGGLKIADLISEGRR